MSYANLKVKKKIEWNKKKAMRFRIFWLKIKKVNVIEFKIEIFLTKKAATTIKKEEKKSENKWNENT